MTITRKQFLQGTLATVAAGAIVACGADDRPTPGGGGGKKPPTGGAGGGGPGTTGSGGAPGTTSSGGAPGTTGSGGDANPNACPSTTISYADSGGCVDNHASGNAHTLTVTADDIAAGVAKEYDIQGVSNHTHKLTITPPQFGQLAQGNSVGPIESTAGGTTVHCHSVTISCN